MDASGDVGRRSFRDVFVRTQRRTRRRREPIAPDLCPVDDVLRARVSPGAMEPACFGFSVRARRIYRAALFALRDADGLFNPMACAAEAARALATLHAATYQCVKQLDETGRNYCE